MSVGRLALIATLLATACFARTEPPEASRLVIPETSSSARPAPGLQTLDQGLGFLYVPASAPAPKGLPLIVLLHPASGAAGKWFSQNDRAGSFAARAEALHCAILAPQSPGQTWGVGPRAFGSDVAVINRALATAFARCPIDPQRLTLSGFSDGASYALSLGLANGDRIKNIVAFSPGFIVKALGHGRPGIYIAHGREDSALPYEMTEKFVRQLRANGYTIEFKTFEGKHELPTEVVNAAMRWLGPRL